MQRVDDVTGEPIKQSATDRERWRQDTEKQVQNLIAACNQLYARVISLEETRNEFVLEVKPAIWRELGLLDDKIVSFRYVPIWRRVWDAVRGR